MQIAATKDIVGETPQSGAPDQRRNLIAACLAHALHDGYTDQLYALLPVWQAQFGLSYAGLAAVRALYYGTMGGLQIPADRLIRHFSARTALVLSTVIAAMGFLLMATPLGFTGLCVGLVLAGLGSSVQHPRASVLVANTYGKASRGPLGSRVRTLTVNLAISPVGLVMSGLATCSCVWKPAGPIVAFWESITVSSER